MQSVQVEFADFVGRIAQTATLQAVINTIEKDEEKFRDCPEFLESLSRIKMALTAVAGGIENIGSLRKENPPELFDPRKHERKPAIEIGSF